MKEIPGLGSGGAGEWEVGEFQRFQGWIGGHPVPGMFQGWTGGHPMPAMLWVHSSGSWSVNLAGFTL